MKFIYEGWNREGVLHFVQLRSGSAGVESLDRWSLRTEEPPNPYRPKTDSEEVVILNYTWLLPKCSGTRKIPGVTNMPREVTCKKCVKREVRKCKSLRNPHWCQWCWKTKEGEQ